MAQAKLYSDAKLIRMGRLLVSIILAALAPVLALFVPEAKPTIAIIGGVWALLTYFPFRTLQKQKVKQAATVQEQLDIELFDLPWNQVLVGNKVAPEIIHSTERASKENRERFRNWYSDTGSIPYPLDVLLCQRANTVWDWRLRRHYAARIGWLTGAVLAVDVIVSLLLKQSFSDFLLSLFIPTLPVLTQGVENFLAHRESAAEKEELAHRIGALWDIGMREPEAVTREQCRQIQDRIYALRKDGPLVPDKWYHWLKKDYQLDMDITAQDLRAKAEKTLLRGERVQS